MAPSFEEQEGYYYGLHSRPKLVARSSTDPWVDKFDFATQYPIGKLLNPVGQHPIVGLWSTELRRDIVLALDGIQWNVIDVLRLGYERVLNTPEDAEQPGHCLKPGRRVHQGPSTEHVPAALSVKPPAGSAGRS
ncbi:hypothetical protein AUP68_06109 [Ilyonectria robusta]